MIRTAGCDDYPQLAQLHAASFERGWSVEEIRNLLDQPGCIAFVYAAHDGFPAGFVLLRCAADECEILTIAVNAMFQRQGIGHALLQHAFEHAGNNGCQSLFLEVAEDNLPARALYAASGYLEHGRRKGYYRRWHGRRIDALLLSRPIAPV